MHCEANISETDLRDVHDFGQSHTLVTTQVTQAAKDPVTLLRFIHRYAHWNGYFGSGVASLAGKIGRCRALFLDPEADFPELGDRSVLVASYFFDAARDEFDDHETPGRDPHRDLAQATVLGLIQDCIAPSADKKDLVSIFGLGEPINLVPSTNTHRGPLIRGTLQIPMWLDVLGHRVAISYGNLGPDTASAVLRAMGYHLGSEILADEEFTTIDRILRASCGNLVERLKSTEIEIAGTKHNAYAWINIHSGGGSAVEADHFAWAIRGVHHALQYSPPTTRDDLRQQVILGFRDFARDHLEFFEHVNT